VVTLDRVIGQGVKSGEPLLTIHDLSSPYVMGYVSERDVGAVRVGQEVRVRLPASSGFRGKGKVVRTGRVLEGEQRTLSIWVELATRPTQPLLHGQLAGLTLIRGTGLLTRPDGSGEPSYVNSLAVPLAAVIHEGTRAYVFVEHGGRFERRPVDLGRADDRWVEVSGGLRPGEIVAVRGAEGLQTAYAGLRPGD